LSACIRSRDAEEGKFATLTFLPPFFPLSFPSSLPQQWTAKYLPVEAYPLCVLCIGMSSFVRPLSLLSRPFSSSKLTFPAVEQGTIWLIRSLGTDVTLRLFPKRVGEAEQTPAWESEKALAGKW
jgi:hypothetical protein